MALVQDKVIVTCALDGVLTKREQCPYIPYSPVEIAEEARRAYEAGAAVVHIHAREPDTGDQSWSTDIYRQIRDEVRKRCPIIINFSTGGFNMGVEGEDEKRARIGYVNETRPEMAALNMGSMNYAKYSEKRKGFVFDFVFPNPFSDIIIAAEAMRAGGSKPELECFDVGHIHNAQPLIAMGLLKPPLQYSFVLGVLGGVAPTMENLAHMARQVGPEDTWEVIGISKVQWPLVMGALVLGGNIRVGLEDNFYLDTAGREMAKGNGPLVEKAVRLARDAGREPMTPAEARAALGIPQLG
ncbi:3-keto-5-aminohexanoate cleavage protein [Corallococcus sp. H22C18031201]|uniref:3-keto-5-aminohexanoate cleavage protein n=1 Tax=Citreicoccus inhibens TaxID=2849499 RepID=UPI000E741843|nr:3-keto-5-aminohexanoate cleavage protein [Citreicoccus inhibens]MBU8900559.1 3-keto-5-aminohexanoate cleavage protein [Citreicoccus inhibens]RJS26920.1 3-keto-5-aminohexanoate cleavage protein [Corallococcus sp. H22C18031201]